MRATTLMRCAGLALVLAVALPAPASPQIGGFLKKKLKQAVAQTIVGNDTTTQAAPTTGAAPTSGAAARAPGARKGSPAPAGPTFTEYVLEITPAVLDQLEKGLAAEQADRSLAAAEAAKILSRDDYKKCEQAVYGSPEGRKVYQDYAAMPRNTQQEILQSSQTYAKQLDQLIRPKCGPGGSEAEVARSNLLERPVQAGEAASGMTKYAYAILKERVIPFCALPQPPAPAASGETRVSAGSGYSGALAYVYGPGEVAALSGRCGKLMAALSPQESSAAPVSAKKKKP